MRLIFNLVLISSYLSGCIRLSVQPLLEPLPKPFKENCRLDFYLNGTKMEGKIEELCAIDSSHPDVPWHRTNTDEVVDRIIDQACYCGAQGFLVNNYSGTHLQGLAFRYVNGGQIDRELAITLEQFKKIADCRFRLGVWVNDSCKMLPPISVRERQNVRN